MICTISTTTLEGWGVGYGEKEREGEAIDEKRQRERCSLYLQLCRPEHYNVEAIQLQQTHPHSLSPSPSSSHPPATSASSSRRTLHPHTPHSTVSILTLFYGLFWVFFFQLLGWSGRFFIKGKGSREYFFIFNSCFDTNYSIIPFFSLQNILSLYISFFCSFFCSRAQLWMVF